MLLWNYFTADLRKRFDDLRKDREKGKRGERDLGSKAGEEREKKKSKLIVIFQGYCCGEQIQSLVGLSERLWSKHLRIIQ